MLSGFISILARAVAISRKRRTQRIAVPISFFRYIGDIITPIPTDGTRPLEVFVQMVDILDTVISTP